MKKYGKGIALALVFALVFGLFAGLGLYGGSDDTMAKAAYTKGANEYLVLEIVPDASVKDDATISANLTVGTSGNIPAGKTVKVITATPDTLDGSDFEYIKYADLFVIHQNSSKTFFSKDISWKAAYEIFKKVVGIEGEPAKYIIDKTVFSGATKSKLDWYPKMFLSDGISGYTGMYISPYDEKDGDKYNKVGYSNNITKLYMMLEVMDPGTFYGLYFSGCQDSQYIDKNTGEFITIGPDYNGNPNIQEAAYRMSMWGPKFFIPYFLYSNTWYISPDEYAAIGAEITGANESVDITNNQNYKRGYVYSGNLSSGISGFNSKTFNSVSNNGHTYRVLCVSPNKTSGAGSKVALGILAAAKGSESLIGGIKLSAMSMYQFAGDTDKLKDKYDVIYFEDGTDNNNNNNNLRKALYGKKDNSKTYDVPSEYQRDKTTAHYAGLDITDQKQSELDSFGKLVIVQKSLQTGASGWGNSNVKSYISGFTSNGTTKLIDNNDLDYTSVKSKIDAFALDMRIISLPTIYQADVEFDWYCENGGRGFGNWQDYYTKNLSFSSDSVRYLKKSSDSNYYLKFKVDVPSGTTLKLYIDRNNDGRFKETPVSKSGSGVTELTHNLGNDISGAVYWKLEATNGSKMAYVTGCSAIKPSNKQTLNILQVIPWDESGNDWGNSQDKAATNVLLPMKSEIEAAKNATRVNGSGKRGDITQYNINYDSGSRLMIDTYFDGFLKVQTKDDPTDYTHNSYSIVKFSGSDGKISQSDWITNSDGNQVAAARPKALLTNAGLFYYFLEKTGAYDLNVLRISTKEFSERLGISEDDATNSKYRIYQNEENGALYYMDPTTDKAGTDPKFVGCDLLMLGGSNRFVNTTDSRYDSSSDIAVSTIKKYLEGGQHAYIGGGVLMAEKNNALANAILDVMGFNRYGSNKTDNFTHLAYTTQVRNNSGVAEAVKTNEGAMTSYPYAIPDDIRIANSSSSAPYFQLKLDDTESISVFYATTALSTGKQGFDGIGDVINNYYLYKKDNITFANVGMNHGNVWGQKAYAFKIPEAALLVNAITSTSDPGDNDPPTPKFTLNFVDKNDDSIIAANTITGNLTSASTAKKTIEANMPTGYGWNKTSDPIVVKMKDGSAAATAVIENDKVESNKLSFKFSDTAGFDGEYVITVKVSRPDYIIEFYYKPDMTVAGSFTKIATSEPVALNYGETSKTIDVILPATTLKAVGYGISSSISSRVAGTDYSITRNTTWNMYGTAPVPVVINDNKGFDGRYTLRIEVTGEYDPDSAAYKIVVKDKNGVVINADAASGDLEYDSTSAVTLPAVTYNADVYDYDRVETKDGKGTVTASHSSGSVTCTLRDASGFEDDYIVYVILDPKEIEQPPIPTIKVENPDKTETKDGDTDTDHDGKPDGIIDTVPSDPSLPPSPSYDPADPSTGIRYVKYTDYLYPDYETDATGAEKVAESDYLYKTTVPGMSEEQYVMKVVFSVDLGKNSSGNPVPAVIDVQVNDPSDATKRASLNLKVYDASTGNEVTGNKITDPTKKYYVEVPITNAYYQKLASAGQLNGINATKFGMDKVDGFGVTIVGTPEGGSKFGVKTKVNFVKRGMFRID